MKQIRPRLDVNFLVICVLLSLSAAISVHGGEKRPAIAPLIKFQLIGVSKVEDLVFHSDPVNVRGRITDPQGRPIVGAKVRGEPVPYECGELAKVFPTRFAVSGTDGSYELKGLVPPNISRVASYLVGFDPTEFGQYPCYVRVYVNAESFVQDMENAPRVPVITEDMLCKARRFIKIWRLLWRLLGRPDLREKDGIYLPPSDGNTITGIDIVLKKAGLDKKGEKHNNSEP